MKDQRNMELYKKRDFIYGVLTPLSVAQSVLRRMAGDY
jgi:hypothetical protein